MSISDDRVARKFSFCSDHRTNIGGNTTNVASNAFGTIHTLPVAFGYLKIIEKQQPKYVDKLTPHITKLLQKLIKDHTSAGVDYNAGKSPRTCSFNLSVHTFLLHCSLYGIYH